MATTPSLPAQAAAARREHAVAVKTLAAAQAAVVAAQKAGKTPAPELLKAVEAATTAVKSTQLATNNATAAVTSASGKTPPATGTGVPNSIASAGNSNGGVSPLVDPGAKQLPYNLASQSPSAGSLLSNRQGLLNTLGATALGAVAANPLGAISLAGSVASLFKSTKDVIPASTDVPKSAPPVTPTSDPSQFPAYDDNGNLMPGFAINEETGQTYYKGEGPTASKPDAGEDPYVSNGETTVTPIQQDSGEDPYVSNEATTITPIKQDLGEDPYVSNEATTITPIKQDLGEDPYVSNEATTITPIQQDTGEDPYVSNEATTITPIKQDVGEDPYVSNEATTITPIKQDVGEDPYVSNEASTIPETPATPEPVGLTPEQQAMLDANDPVGIGTEPEAVENVFDPGTTFGGEEETVFDPANVDPNSDPFEQARYEAQQRLDEENPESGLFPDDGEDPYVSNGEATITPIVQDDGEDPYVSNQASTIPEVGAAPDAVENVFDPGITGGNEESVFNPDADSESAAIKQGTLDKAKAQNTIANQRRSPNNGDWRVKLRLAPGANYLYNAPDPGILQPLKGTGIIFPYTPTITTSYKANYASYDLTHSNYKGYYYQSSAVEPVTLSCPFTAQSTPEAEYLLAVIHFFKSVTKMFYGQDAERGTPPPLVYLTGLGEYQFNEHPCVVQSFSYELPTDVDYIRARSPNVNNSNMLNKRQSTNPTGPGTTFGGGILGNVLGGAINRLANAGLPKGGMNKPPAPASFGQNSPTYVPTKINISISLLPVQSRKQQSQEFSLKQYASGDLLKGGFW